ncbi:MAG: nitrilase-related carbon-nitrogen hydrolase [Hyphomicrobium sp.]
MSARLSSSSTSPTIPGSTARSGRQHAHHARIRAVETGLPLVRVGNSGVTMVTDPLGRVTARLAEREMAVIDVDPTLPLAGTPFRWLGMWPFWIAVVLGIAISVLTARPRRRLRHNVPPRAS